VVGIEKSAVESLVNPLNTFFGGVYSGKTVFITGHTGFKGSWLALWLHSLGAHVIGFSLEPPTKPSLFETLGLSKQITHIIGDVRNFDALCTEMARHQPEFVFHLAAQPLVRLSYDEPVDTFATNIMGTINVLEAVRKTPSVRVCLCITSDKCYENREWVYAYRENDPMGGFDPYSASKGAAELVVASYRSSFFHPECYDAHQVAVATARAGNVIGGGDWAKDRIVPDIIRALANHELVPIRNPGAIRPWQHVLEPLSGYLLLAARMRENGRDFSPAWNFGPTATANIPVMELAKQAVSIWGKGEIHDLSAHQKNAPHEATFLKLDCAKAMNVLHWRPAWSVSQTISETISWYHGYYNDPNFSARSASIAQINAYSLVHGRF